MSDDQKRDDLEKSLETRQVAWQAFEEEIARYLEKEFIFQNMILNPKTATVRRKPRYYSKLRESEIIFDASIELRLTSQDESPSVTWIWECKDYPDRNVSVEEVHDKMRQVGAHKGTIATRKGFATGAITLAKSYGIGLIIIKKEEVAKLLFSRDGGLRRAIWLSGVFCVFSTGEEYAEMELGDIISREININGILNTYMKKSLANFST
jgi:hypothetical protein